MNFEMNLERKTPSLSPPKRGRIKENAKYNPLKGRELTNTTSISPLERERIKKGEISPLYLPLKVEELTNTPSVLPLRERKLKRGQNISSTSPQKGENLRGGENAENTARQPKMVMFNSLNIKKEQENGN